MAPKGVKRKRSCRVRGGIDPNDSDENYEWFTFDELTNMYGSEHAFLVHGCQHIPTRVSLQSPTILRKCAVSQCDDVLEYGILKKVCATMIKEKVRRAKGMQAFAL